MHIYGFGDIHMATANLRKFPSFKKADLLLVSGDITNFGGRDEAEAILKTIHEINANCLCLSGNLDHIEVNTFLEEQKCSIHGRATIVEGLGIIGVGGSNPTPFNTPTEFSEDEIAALLAKGYAALHNHSPFILVSHPPPYGTKTDKLRSGAHVGSHAVRQFIEKYQPDVCLTGHIHEARALDKIDKCMVINPGMLQDGGIAEIRYDGRNIAVKEVCIPA